MVLMHLVDDTSRTVGYTTSAPSLTEVGSLVTPQMVTGLSFEVLYMRIYKGVVLHIAFKTVQFGF